MQPPAFISISKNPKDEINYGKKGKETVLKNNKTGNGGETVLETTMDSTQMVKKPNSGQKKNAVNSGSEDGLIFNPKNFEIQAEEFLRNFHFSSEKTLKNQKEKIDLQPMTEEENNDNITPPKIITSFPLTSSSASSTTAASFSTSFSLLNFERIIFKSLEGRCLESLIRIKTYLKSVYSLSDEKCQSYCPDDKVIHLVSFYFVSFCFVLFHFILFYFISFCFVLFCSVLFCFILFCSVLFCFVLFYLTQLLSIFHASVLFCFVLF
jgi:hypothetical protein